MIPAALFAKLPETVTYRPRSDGFVLEHPMARIRVRERVRPIAAAGAVFASLRRELGFAPPAPQRAPEVLTRDGERAAVHHLIDGDRSCSLGVVFGDDFYRSIVGTSDAATAPVVRAIVDQLIVELPLGLARRRRRWFGYAPPPGWGGHVRHRMIAEWFAPRFPREHAILTVFPARPFSDTPAGAMDRHLHEMSWGGYTKESMEGPEMVTLSERLAGVRWNLVGTWLDDARTFTDVVVLHDGTFLYMVRLDHDGSATDAHRAILEGVIRSIKPLPAERTRAHDPITHVVD